MNLGENNNFFRESFRGFNKDDVAEYIAKLSKDYTANEEKYKELIAKLHAEVKTKTEEIENLESGREPPIGEIEKKYRNEINKLMNDLNERDIKIINLQTLNEQAQAGNNNAPETPELSELRNEISKSKETIYNLSKEIEELMERCEQAESKETPELFKQVNQLSFQLAEAESEKLYFFNLLKKFIFMLDIESSKDKNSEKITALSDIASKSVIASEIEAEIANLIAFRQKAEELEAANAELNQTITGLNETIAKLENQIAQSNEQQMYESITADLGSIIYSAKKSAEDLVIKAKGEADVIMENARAEANEVLDSAISQRVGITEESKKILEDFKKKYEFIKQEHEGMVQKYKEISGKYALRLTELEETLNIIYDAVTDVDFYEE